MAQVEFGRMSGILGGTTREKGFWGVTMTKARPTRRNTGACLPTLLIGASMIAGATASAADTAPALEQVVVTARHRAEKLQSVPIAISTLDSKKLQASGVTAVSQLQKLVPTLQITQFNPRNTSFNIRGLGNNAAIAIDGIESGVGLYVDGVFYSRPAQATFAFPDLEDIQVLRGPQGTLFGKNTTAGAIDVHTLKPSFTPSADLEASVGNDGYWQFKGTATAPITDKIAVRISALWDDNTGSISNPTTGARFDATNDRAVRVQALALVTDDLTVRIIADYGRQRDSAPVALPYEVITTLTDGQPFPDGFYERLARLDYTVPTYDPRQRNTYDNISPHYTMETGGVSAQADYATALGTFTSITSWRFWNWDPVNDVDSTALSVLDAYSLTDKQRQASQEFRYTSPSGGRFDYSAGLYYFYEDLPGTSRIGFGPDAGDFLVVPKLPLNLANIAMTGLNIYGISDIITNSAAAYTQATYHVTPQFDITGGLRFTYETKDGGFGESQFGAEPYSDIAPGLVPIIKLVRNTFGIPYPDRVEHTYDSALSGTIIGSYKVSPTTFLYASYSRGDKGSGINALNLPAGVNPVAKPERVDAYELGAKTAFLNGRVVVNGDLFWSEDHDYQGVAIAPLNASLYATYIDNVPQVRSRGFEIDSHAFLAPGLLLNFAGAFTDAEYTKFPDAPCPPEVAGPAAETCSLTGSAVAGISRWTMSAGGQYSHPIGRFGVYDLIGYGGADYSLRSSYNVSPSDSAYAKIAGYGLLDLNLGVRTANRRYDFSIWAHNALNTFYLVGAGTTAPITGLVIAIPGDPAMYGMTFRAHF